MSVDLFLLGCRPRFAFLRHWATNRVRIPHSNNMRLYEEGKWDCSSQGGAGTVEFDITTLFNSESAPFDVHVASVRPDRTCAFVMPSYDSDSPRLCARLGIFLSRKHNYTYSLLSRFTHLRRIMPARKSRRISKSDSKSLKKTPDVASIALTRE